MKHRRTITTTLIFISFSLTINACFIRSNDPAKHKTSTKRAALQAPKLITSVNLLQQNVLQSNRFKKTIVFGVPFADQLVTPQHVCQVLSSDLQQKVAATCEPMSFWSTNKKYVKWMRVSYTSTFFKAKKPRLVLQILSAPTQDDLCLEANHIVKQSSVDKLLVNNGHMLFSITTEAIFADYQLVGMQSQAPLNTKLTLTDDQGKKYIGKLTKAPLLEQGNCQHAVVLLEGAYVNPNNTQEIFNHFQMRLYLAKAQTTFELEHTIILSSQEFQTRGIQSLQLQFSPQGAGQRYQRVTFDGEATVHLQNQESASLLFSNIASTEISRTNTPTKLGQNKKRGYVHAENSHYQIGVAIRNPHLEFPKAFVIEPDPRNGNHLSVDLWPAFHGQKDRLTRWPAAQGKLDLRNEFLGAQGFLCIGKVNNGDNTISSPIRSKPRIQCQRWIGATEVQKASIISTLQNNPTFPLILVNNEGDNLATQDFFQRCGVHCQNRKIITDSRGNYGSSAEGIAKTNRLVVEILARTDANGQRPVSSIGEIAQELTHPSFTHAVKEHIESTGVLGHYLSSSLSPTITSNMQRIFTEGIAENDTHKLYGFLRFGQEASLHTDGPTGQVLQAFPNRSHVSITGFYNNEAHDITESCWWHFIRTEKRDAWEFALHKSRYLIDLSTIWKHSKAWRVGLQNRHSLYPWSDPDMTHSLAGGISLFHYLTGDRRARQAIINLGDASLRDYWPQHKAFGRIQSLDLGVPTPQSKGTLRTHTAPWLNLMHAYELTKNPALHTALQEFLPSLLALQEQDGGIPGNSVTVDAQGSLKGSGSKDAYQMSLWSSLRTYIRLFGTTPALQDFLLKFVTRELLAQPERSIASTHQKKFALLAWAYQQTDRVEFLGYYPALLASAPTMSAPSARQYLPKTIGPYLKEVKRFFDGGGTTTDINNAFNRFLMRHTHSQLIEVSKHNGPSPLVLTLTEASDRPFQIRAKGRFNYKHSNTAVRIELHGPDPANPGQSRLLFFKEYCDKTIGCPDHAIHDQCGMPGNLNVVEAQCQTPNNPSYRAQGAYWQGDDLNIRVKKDGVVGNYHIKVVNLTDDNDAKNAVWTFTTTLNSGTETQHVGSLMLDLQAPTILSSQKGFFFLENPDPIAKTLQLYTANTFSALYRLTPTGEFSGFLEGRDFVSVLNPTHDLDFQANSSLLSVEQGAPGVRIPFSLTHGLNTGGKRFQRIRLSEQASRSAKITINGQPFLQKIQLANPNLEAVAPQGATQFPGWLVAGPGQFTLLQGANAIEANHSVGLNTASTSLYQDLHDIAQPGDTLHLRVIGRTTHKKGCYAELRPVFKYTDTGKTVGNDELKKLSLAFPISLNQADTISGNLEIQRSVPNGRPIALKFVRISFRSHGNVSGGIAPALDCAADAFELYLVKRAAN